MKEFEWFSSRDIEGMLAFVRTRPGATRCKLVLFGCGCARAIWHQLGELGRAEVEAQETLVDGSATAVAREAPPERCESMASSVAPVHVAGSADQTAVWAAAGEFA